MTSAVIEPEDTFKPRVRTSKSTKFLRPYLMKDRSKGVQNIDEEPVSKKLKPGTFSTIDSEITSTTKLSKRQQKRLLRREKWVANKAIRREKDREKLRRKNLEAKLNNIELGPSRKKLKECKMSSSNCKVSVAIDFSFNDLMNDKDLAKSLKQVNRCYSLNRRSTNPLQFHVTNFQGRARNEMKRNVGYENWDVYFHSESHLQVFKKDQIVYLTSESDNVVTKFEDGKVYIIGGLVDHNSHKGLCYETAIKQCIAHARLPIGEFMEMKHRKVLSIYHVFEILLNVCQGMSWAESLIKALPKRVGAVTKSAASAPEQTPTGGCTSQETEVVETVNTISAESAANTPEQALLVSSTCQEAEDDEEVITMSAKSAASEPPTQMPTGDSIGQEAEDSIGQEAEDNGEVNTVSADSSQVQELISR